MQKEFWNFTSGKGKSQIGILNSLSFNQTKMITVKQFKS